MTCQYVKWPEGRETEASAIAFEGAVNSCEQYTNFTRSTKSRTLPPYYYPLRSLIPDGFTTVGY